jgi:xanthine dehydrogenase YagR molybdenum-binding subunit
MQNDMLCVPELEPTDVTRVPWDSDLPFAGPSFSSATTLGMGAAVQDAARRVVAQLAVLAGRPTSDTYAEKGELHRGSHSRPIGELKCG